MKMCVGWNSLRNQQAELLGSGSIRRWIEGVARGTVGAFIQGTPLRVGRLRVSMFTNCAPPEPEL